jgi:hypothetical protein
VSAYLDQSIRVYNFYISKILSIYLDNLSVNGFYLSGGFSSNSSKFFSKFLAYEIVLDFIINKDLYFYSA